ncbi:hypothetical protein MRB53_016867 [Persea americana]|uniref:Uncharacterized protein n=1 Tax=Persea americana TaxID=3435 RepID=A0ACC2M434_PERAE|nr:hypothetical protein MRB53_016867 [Persea americana]
MEVEHIGDATECGAGATEPSRQKQKSTNDTETSGVKEGLSELKAHLARIRAAVKYVKGSHKENNASRSVWRWRGWHVVKV